MSTTDATDLRSQIQELIANEPVSLFMKGTPQLIMCGNSDRRRRGRFSRPPAPRSRRSTCCPTRSSARSSRPSRAGRPFPRSSSRAELIGGADIVEELAANGELRQRLDDALGSERDASVKVAQLVS